MTFKVITGNRLESLAKRLVASLEADPGWRQPLAAAEVVVPSQGMGRWLAMEMAARTGIAANLKFPFLMAFVQRELLGLGGGDPEEAPMSKALMAWRIRAALPALLAADGDFASVVEYLQEDPDGLKAHQLADHLGELFDAYVIQRPEWILAWDAGRQPPELAGVAEAIWQGKLWRAISADWRGRHFPARLQALETSLAGMSERFRGQTIRLFGFSSMPVQALALLVRLGQVAELEFYYFSPCRSYWEEAKPGKELLRDYKKALETLEKNPECNFSKEAELLKELFLVGNPLLGSYAKAGREFFTALLAEDEVEEQPEGFEEIAGTSQLAMVQRQILDNARPAGRPADWPADGSLQFHSCYSPMREVEVLHDELRRMFASDSSLQPKDVFVMTPDLATYAPLVDAVFNNPALPREHQIRVSVADLAMGAGQHVPEALVKILKSGLGRFSASEVFDIFGCPAVRHRFGVGADGLELLRQWAKEAGIRWGRDASDRQRACGVEFAEGSWRAGLDRMLLGYAMRPRTDGGAGLAAAPEMLSGILPFDRIEGKNGLLLGNLAEFVDRLGDTAAALSMERRETVETWAKVIGGILEQFFDAETDEESADGFKTVWSCLNKLQRRARLAGAGGALPTAGVPVSLAAMVFELEQALAAPSREGGFLNGRTTLCRMMPMRSIPAKVICLLGMNHDSFPGRDDKSGLDLTKGRRRRGDKSRREEDRQLFLEALLSARQRFYVSHVGKDVRNNQERPDSSVVSELKAYLKELFGEQGLSVTEHALQPFHASYFNGVRNPSFSAINCQAAQRLAGERRPPAGTVYRPAFAEAVGTPPPEELLALSIDELIRFFKHPADYFLRRRLKANPFDDQAEELEDTEPFELGKLQRYGIFQPLVPLLRERPVAEAAALLEPLLRAQSQLPVGDAGRLQLLKMAAEAKPYAEALEPGSKTTAELLLAHEGMTLQGRVTTQAQTLWRFGKVRGRDRLELMIRHLASCCKAETESTGYYEDETLRLAHDAKAEEKLRRLLMLYRAGLERPLLFFPQTSWVLYEDGKGKALRAWEGGDESSGPGEVERFRFYFGEDLIWAAGLPPAATEECMELARSVYGLVDDWKQGRRQP